MTPGTEQEARLRAERDAARRQYENLLRAGQDQTNAFDECRAERDRLREALEAAALGQCDHKRTRWNCPACQLRAARRSAAELENYVDAVREWADAVFHEAWWGTDAGRFKAAGEIRHILGIPPDSLVVHDAISEQEQDRLRAENAELARALAAAQRIARECGPGLDSDDPQDAAYLAALSEQEGGGEGEQQGARCPECGELDEGNDAHDGECSQIFPYLTPAELATFEKLRPCFVEAWKRESVQKGEQPQEGGERGLSEGAEDGGTMVDARHEPSHPLAESHPARCPTFHNPQEENDG